MRRHVARISAGGFHPALIALLLAAGCAQPPAPLPAAPEPGRLGVLDAAYDRSKWRWVRNLDGRALLAHAEIPLCYLDPQPATHFDAPAFTVKKEEKTFGGVRYTVMDVFEGRQFSETVYLRAAEPLLTVYSPGACRTEAERILERYEQTRKP